jgi:outer membrane protein, heavy metal efflux system
MKALAATLCLWAVGASSPIAVAQAAEKPPVLAAVLSLIDGQHNHQPASGPALTLDEAERIALSANPEIEVAARRVTMAEKHVPQAGALDDPMAMYRGWGIPLQKPWDFNVAQNMFSVSQTLPGGNKRALRTSVAEADVTEARANLAAVRLSLQVRVRKAFNDLLLTQDEIRFHDQHVGIARQAVEAARIKYSVGNVPQQDVLKAEVALTALAEHMIHFERDADVARARLNTLLARNPAAPIAVSGTHAVLDKLPSLESLEADALQARPDLAAAQAAAERSRREQALTKKAYTPDFTVSAGYMLMPSGTDMRNDYMIEGTMNLPWLNRRKHDAEIAEATVKTTEQEAEFAAMRNAARGEIEEALLEAQSAQRLAQLYHDQLRPQAEATLQSSVIAYQNDKTGLVDLLDSQMTVVDADLAWIQAVGAFDARLADLELATGAAFRDMQQTGAEVKP